MVSDLSEKFVDSFMDTYIHVKDYGYFSTIEINCGNDWMTIGMGVLNRIFLFPKAERNLKH
ncbi:hypothetical protein [uncultured Apibacter sp.]|uniref:hypothetical protein n=1 Tax=uncultured Apibacter sp. TaxID=1778616 RepID=UPI0025DC5A2A|nr:hypothetical protein [uncultured Apibacter sp.]